jgi:hydroxyacyl-ACP dehydratase HTD2-like protein with hotdog domain
VLLLTLPAADMPTPDYTLAYTPSSPLLFRYSALTYNAHKIHYDLAWTRSMEGHPDLVVHGPMTATLLVELADRAAGDTGTHLTRFEYRASSPMYVDREIKLQAAWEKRGERMVVWAEQEGRVGMKATATYTPA